MAILTKRDLAESYIGFPSVPQRTLVIKGGYNSIVGIVLLIITFLGN
jgi:hypothetical protein